ncbi:hypothetical protein [Rhodococcus sp. LB1]|uniref:hypothetical protein n=1 Tax=Rhodococcus sp. LB1 TaxID=1807499 RepID=UPI000A87B0BF|nr:hypothetical protein [Rhodococcus sp. LB1]
MTAAVPHSPRADNRMCSSTDGIGSENRKRHGSRLPALSIGRCPWRRSGWSDSASSWAWPRWSAEPSPRLRSTVADDEAASKRALLGIVAGAAGITVSAIALFPMLAQL